MEDNVKKGPAALVLPMILLLALILFVIVIIKGCGGYFKSSENVTHNQPGVSFTAGNQAASPDAASLKDSAAALKDSASTASAPADSTGH